MHGQSQQRQDLRAALAPWIFAEIHRDSKKRSEPFTPQDFMPGAKKTEPRQQSIEEMRANIALFGTENADLPEWAHWRKN